MTSAPQDPVDSFKNRPSSQPVLSPAMMKDAEQPELWIDRFRKLENALYLCDLSNTGKVWIPKPTNLSLFVF